MTVVLGWRLMRPEMCSHCGELPVLSGMRGGHLQSRLSNPAVCLGYDCGVAAMHLQHHKDWKAPLEHQICAWQRKATFKLTGNQDFLHNAFHLAPPAPHEYCTCGYYILWQPAVGGTTNLANYQRCWCYVLAIGKYAAYTEGARVARYRLLRWWRPMDSNNNDETWYPTPGSVLSHLYNEDAVLTWDEVLEKLTQRYGMKPLATDPREAGLPSGVLTEVPDVVAQMLEEDVWSGT